MDAHEDFIKLKDLLELMHGDQRSLEEIKRSVLNRTMPKPLTEQIERIPTENGVEEYVFKQ